MADTTINHHHNDTISAWDRAHFMHPSTDLAAFARAEAPNRIIKTAKDCTIVDREGNRLLDGFAGLYCVNIGYGRQEIAEAISRQAHELAYYHAYVGHGTEASVTLARMVAERAPEGLNHVFFGLGGSDANETNIKLVWQYNNILGRPEKKKIISRWRGYHGSGLMSGSLTGLVPFHKSFDLPLSPVLHTEAAYFLRRPDASMDEAAFSAWCAAELEAMIQREGPETIAAFIAEPIMGTGGIVPPPAGYWAAIQPVLKKYDILLIADEVVTGFGRTGSMFGSTHYGISPDIITIAKGLTSAYAPLSGSILHDDFYAVLMQGCDEMGPIGHGWTYSAHPIGAAAGMANLTLLDELGLIDNAAKVGAHLNTAMAQAFAGHPNLGEVRGEGMLCAVEFMADPEGRRFFDPAQKIGAQISAEMAKLGVIGRAMPQGDIIGLAPPFCLTTDQADEIVAATRQAAKTVLGH